ncbi:unnamed protein product [Mytilus coruscus]|uniref:TRIM2_3 n=1 Tax=Mytilus coruscus TaxID=42192 RepID=A0A6J8BCQ7_MYTCO|nr:unnamed protein product [Mytilus coruscus]
MAQMLAVPGDVRHGFSYNCALNHDFGRITSIAATQKGNILLCDYDKKNLLLVDSLGKYLKKLYFDSEPSDVAITIQNIGYVTQPNTRSVLRIDPDRMLILMKATCTELHTSVVCASAVPFTTYTVKMIDQNSIICFLCLNANGGYTPIIGINHKYLYLNNIYTLQNQYKTIYDVVKFHAVNENSFCFCVAGEHDILVGNPPQACTIATIDTPTDVCSDDNGHLCVSGQYSNNIHRLTQEGNVLDIPLHSQHEIKEPVAMCFNKNYTKLYIVNEWGKSVLVFDVY